LAALFDEEVDSGVGRPSENFVAVRFEGVGFDFVPAGMGDAHGGAESGGERMLGEDLVFEDAELFVIEWLAQNAVAVQNSSVRSQTRQNRRNRIALGPVGRGDTLRRSTSGA